MRGLPAPVRADAAGIVEMGGSYWQVDAPLTHPSDDGSGEVVSRRITEMYPFMGPEREVMVHTLYPEGGFQIERLGDDGTRVFHCPFGPAVSRTGLEGRAPGEELNPRRMVKKWYIDGVLHCEDGPAVLTGDGGYEWHLNGLLHRVGGPAVVNPTTGEEGWYENGEAHRVDGPALTGRHGDRMWFLHGRKHRVGGPAIEQTDGYREWCVNGERHRVGGPAVESAEGREWWVEGKLHRTDGPAVEIYKGGHQEWWLENRVMTKEEWVRERVSFATPSGRRAAATNPGSISAAMNRR